MDSDPPGPWADATGSDPWALVDAEEKDPWALVDAAAAQEVAPRRGRRRAAEDVPTSAKRRRVAPEEAASSARGREPCPEIPPALRRKVEFGFQPGSVEATVAQASRPRLTDTAAPRRSAKWEAAGCDPQRVRERLSTSSCRCSAAKTACHLGVSPRTLQGACNLFWGLAAAERGHCLRLAYANARRPDVPRVDADGHAGPSDVEHEADDLHFAADNEITERDMRKVEWYLCGVRVCFANFVHLLGTSEPTVRKQLRGEDTDMRTLPSARGPSPQSQLLDTWFYELYQSAAEPLPHRAPDPKGKRRSSGRADADVSRGEEPWLCVGDPLNPEEEEEGAEGSRPVVEWDPEGGKVDALVSTVFRPQGGSSLGLLRRYLPPGRLHDLYWLFVSAWPHLTSLLSDVRTSCPSYSTFVARWQHWKQFMVQRRKLSHTQCMTCWTLQRLMNRATASWDQRMQAARDLREHYQAQYVDRTIYWSARLASRNDQGVLTIIIDSLDKNKIAWPRWPFDRTPKVLENKPRPRLIMTAVIAHGWCTALLLADDHQTHGANAFCESLCFILEQVWQISRTSGRPMPEHLIVQTDNTVAQAKNECAFLFAAYLVCRYKFVTANIFFLMVGHTHEDVDQLLELFISLVLDRHVPFQTPEEFLRSVQREVGPRIAARGEVFICERFPAIRNFWSWLAPCGTSLENCFATRDGIETPHSFSFKLRRNLSAADVAAGEADVQTSRAWRAGGDPGDVMCCVKAFMSSTELMQGPVCVLRRERMRLDELPSQLDKIKSLSDEQIEVWLKLAYHCRNTLDMPAAGQALEDLVNKREYRHTSTEWLATPATLRGAHPDAGHAMFPHLPPTLWRMVAVQRRQ